jgi:hypothetical protein
VSQPIHIFICGISNYPGSQFGWTDKAVRWCNDHDLLADKFEYLSTPWGRRLLQWKRIKDLHAILESYRGHPLKIVAHSNGCELVCQALKRSLIDGCELHLFSPACEASFEKNGLNQALADRRVDRVTVHWGGKDYAMWFAAVSRTLFGWLGLGYGTLGAHGPQNVRSGLRARVKMHFEPVFGHSTWFEDRYFEATMGIATV